MTGLNSQIHNKANIYSKFREYAEVCFVPNGVYHKKRGCEYRYPAIREAMKRLVLGGNWVNKRMKAIRFSLIHVAGRVIAGARQLRIKLSGGLNTYEWMIGLRARTLQLAPATYG